MSSVATTTAAAPSPGAPAPGSAVPQRSFVQMAVRQTFSDWGARLGLVWLVFLAMLAVLGPVIASSHPVYVRTVDGDVSSPLWRSLTPADLALLFGALAGVVTLGLRRRFRPALIAFALAAVAGAGVGAIKGTPATVVYERWRELDRAGQLKTVIWAPIAHSPNDRNRDNPDARRRPPTWADKAVTDTTPAYSYFFLGSDREGSDVASRLIWASRTAIAIGLVATGIAAVIGVIVGGIMGYFAGWIDILGMRAIEIFEAVPRLMLLLAVAAIFNADIFLLMALIGLTGWMGNARFIRAEFLKLRRQDFVQAAEALGLPKRSIIFKHMLPNGITPVLVSVSFGVAGAILIESVLAFLGLSKADQPSWGQLLNQAREGGEFQWWIATFPGLMIFLTVFSYQLIGEALRDALDPKLKKRD